MDHQLEQQQLTCIYSLLNNKKIKNDIAITGEIDLQGVTAIGGLELKILAVLSALNTFYSQRK